MQSKKLVLELTYEDLIKAVDNNLSRMTDLIVPVIEFEVQINQVLNDIRTSGYLLFIHGVTGSGKSTFLSSLRWRSHIPIQRIININASNYIEPSDPRGKLGRLYNALRDTMNNFSQQLASRPNTKLCIAIDYLESLQDEEERDIRAFFRDLNALLRQHPVLVVWPVTTADDVEFMQQSAANFSSTMFHRRLPVMEFTGPPLETYSDIAKKTITILNGGQSYNDFQLNDQDFVTAIEKIKDKPHDRQTIREYLQIIRETWEDRIDYVSTVRATIPHPTEVWFIVCYREAETIVAQFSNRSSISIQDAWNADYSKLSEYARDNQRAAQWHGGSNDRLALALTGVLTTKIMFLPTNALITCIAAYGEDTHVPIKKDELLKLGVPDYWFQKSKARLALLTTPLYLQLVNKTPSKGNRRGGTVASALVTATPALERINQIISGKGENDGSDKPFNKAVAEALKTCFEENSGYKIQAERKHPWLKLIPDVLITTPDKRHICLEFHYTTNTQPNRLAAYCLGKLNTYMTQIEALNDSNQPFLFTDL